MSQIAERTHIGAYVDAEQRDQLFDLARQQDRSVSSIIRVALREHVEREQVAAANLERRDLAGVTPLSR